MSEISTVIVEEDSYYTGGGCPSNEEYSNAEVVSSSGADHCDTPEQGEDSGEDGGEGVEVIANGALCTCKGASNSSLKAPLTTISQQRVYCNGGSLLVATTKDNNIASVTFGSCSLKNNGPCAPNITWQKYYEDLDVMGSLKILTMESIGLCSGMPVQFESSGQSQGATTANISLTETDAASANNPLVRNEDIIIDTSHIREEFNRQIEQFMAEQMQNPDIVEHKEGDGKSVRVGKIEAVTFRVEKRNGVVKQPRISACTFKATDGGTLLWKVRGEDMKVIHESRGAGEITLKFPKYGRYVIEAYGGTTSYVKENTSISDIESKPDNFKNALIVQVCKNEIILKSDKSVCPINGTVKIKTAKLFDQALDVSSLEYKVLKGGTEVSVTEAAITPESDGASVTFKEGGNYVVHATSKDGITVTASGAIKVDNLIVTGVKANGKKEYNARLRENLTFDATLNYADADASQVKWQVEYSSTANGTYKKVYPTGSEHVTEKPPMSVFAEAGYYRVFAFMTSKGPNTKADVRVVKPTFASVEWKTLNGQVIREIGRRETVYANILMEGVVGLTMKYELCELKTHKILKTFEKEMTADRMVIEVEITDKESKTLVEGDKLYWKISCKDSSITISNKTKKTIDYPITYTTKEKIVALTIYEDKSCQKVISAATYGSTIYARALTRNLTGKSLELRLQKKTPGWLWDSNDTLHSSKQTVNEKGVSIFEITISKSWHNKKGTSSYMAAVAEADNGWFDDTSKRNFTVGTNLEFMSFVTETPPAATGKVLTKIGKSGVGSGKTKCERCKKFTEADFKKIFPDVTALFQKGNNSLNSTTIKDFSDELNKAFDEFGIDNCNRKLHFLTQVACETGDFLRIDENLNYSGTSFRNSNWPKSNHPKLYEANAEKTYANKPEVLANYVYRNSGENGDEASSDGYRYRGRGLIQLTYKKNYQLFENYLVEKDKIAKNTIMDNPDLLLSNLGYLVRSAAWFWKYGKSGNGTDRLNINNLADAGNLTKITLWTHGGTSTVPKRAKKYDQLKKIYDLGLCDFFMNYLAKDYAIDYHIKPNIIEKHIPKGKKEDEIFQYRYYYHDENGTEYFLCAVMGYLTQKWLKGSSNAQTGNDWVKVTVDRVTRYYQKDGTNKCLLITIPGTLEIPGLFSYHKNTSRLCANIDHYAVMLAAIADTRYTDFRFNGATDYQGQGHPSVGHINGKNLDIRYLKTKSPELSIYINTKGGWDVLDLDRHNIFMEKSYDRGFKQFYIMPLKTPFPGETKSGWDQMCETLATSLGKSVEDIKDKIYKHGAPHEHHVHLQNLTLENITTIEKE